MKAAVITEFNKPLKLMDVSDPRIENPTDIIIKVKANGICRSDWHAWAGDWEWIGLKPELPRIPGHEFAGVVEEVGKDVRRFKKGDRVVVCFHNGCGYCEFCMNGHHNVCTSMAIFGFHMDGAYAQYVRIPNADVNVTPLPDNVDFITAAGMGCRFMTAFHGVVDQLKVAPGEWFAVHGCGGVGLSAVQIGTALGANVIAVDIDDKKLEMAKKLGAVHTVNAKTSNAPEEIIELTKGGAHASVDALGIAATCRNSIFGLRTRGRHLQLGLTTQNEKGEISIPTDLIVAKEISFVGSIGMQPPRYPAMLNMVVTGKLNPRALVSRTVSLEEAGEVLMGMTDYATLGSVVIDTF
jgi:D-arabinose 1-dehydrogenase-like Zn-dependent alcohol dehydrogenase